MRYKSSPPAVILLLCALTLVADCVQLIRENGFRDQTYFYHLGDGSHAYHANLETAKAIYFKCVMYSSLRCTGRAILYINGRFIHSKPHNHYPDQDFVGERHFRENVLDQIRGARFVNYQEVLDEMRRNRRFTVRVRARMHMRRLRGAMWNARMKSMPPIPHTLRELTQVLLNDNYRNKIASTIDSTDNLYAASCTARDGSHNVLFMSQRMINFLPRLKVIQCDGTFRARPLRPHSAQCLVFVTPWRHAVVPLGWVLMERKSFAAYKSVFELLQNLCPNFRPQKIVTDWEYAQQKAWQETFPNAKVQGCLWHLCRAFIKKVKKLGILRFRNNYPSLILYIRKACAVTLLPAQYFYVGLGVIMDEAREDNIVVAYLLRNFFTYVEQNWIRNRTRRRWMNLFKSTERTNNLCESHNKMLRKAVGAYRPNVWAFIDALAKLEHNAYLDSINRREGGTPSGPRPCRSVWTDNNLLALSEELEEEVFHDRNNSVRDFLNRAINLFHGAFDNHLNNAIG